MPRASVAALAALAAIAALGASGAHAAGLRYIGQQTVPTAESFGGTRIGGLSGIEYIGGNSYLVISDDRSQIGPARFYTAQLDITPAAFTGVTFTAVTTLKNPAGNPYAINTVDPESIRRLANGNILYASEGVTDSGADAFVREALADGTYVRDVTLPTGVQQTGPAGSTGVANNFGFESLTITPDGTIVAATENALRQDGPLAGPGVGSVARILTFDGTTGAPGAQYAYAVPALTATPDPPTGLALNGLVELLSLGGTRYIALERSLVTGLVTPSSATGYSAKLYVIDTAGATDISGLAALDGQSFTPVSKTLLLDLDTLGIPLEGVEGISFGQTLSNGSRSLILVADNDFSPRRNSQFFAFELTESPAGVPEPSAWAMLIAGFGLTGARLRRNARQPA